MTPLIVCPNVVGAPGSTTGTTTGTSTGTAASNTTSTSAGASTASSNTSNMVGGAAGTTTSSGAGAGSSTNPGQQTSGNGGANNKPSVPAPDPSPPPPPDATPDPLTGSVTVDLEHDATYYVFAGQVLAVKGEDKVGEYNISYSTDESNKAKTQIIVFAKDGKFFLPIPQEATGATATSPITLNATATRDAKPNPKTTNVVFRVYPEPSKAQITNIVRIRSQSGETFVIAGTSLMAPANAVDVSVDGKHCDISSVNATEIVATLQGTQSTLNLPIVKLWNIEVNKADNAKSSIQFEGDNGFAAFLAVVIGALMGLSFWLVSLRLTQHAVKRKLGLKKEDKLPFLYLTYEAANRTFSLSKFQFYVWTTVIFGIWFYVLAYDWMTRGAPQLPDLAALGAQFVTSVVTLVAAQTTNAFRGVKGSGETEPKFSDLYTQGGVVAPERLLQLLWTFIGSFAFAVVATFTYPHTAQLPKLDDILFVLMGLPPTAYVAAKIVRNPGPVLDQVVVRADETSGGQKVSIYGSNLSATPMVCIGDSEVPFNLIKDIETATAGTFTSTITINLDKPTADKLGVDAATPTATEFKIINSDGQYAKAQRYDAPK